jgi:hypothetical protein
LHPPGSKFQWTRAAWINHAPVPFVLFACLLVCSPQAPVFTACPQAAAIVGDLLGAAEQQALHWR